MMAWPGVTPHNMHNVLYDNGSPEARTHKGWVEAGLQGYHYQVAVEQTSPDSSARAVS